MARQKLGSEDDELPPFRDARVFEVFSSSLSRCELRVWNIVLGRLRITSNGMGLDSSFKPSTSWRASIGILLSLTAKLTTDSEKLIAARLYFLVWQQFQRYLVQFSMFVEPNSYQRVLAEATDSLLEVAQLWLTLNKIPFEVKKLRELDESDTWNEYPAIVFLPEALSLPGKIASKVAQSGAYPHSFVYSPAYTAPGNWAGKLTENALYVSAEFVIGLVLDPDTGHELFHWKQRILEHSFREDVFQGDVTRVAERPFPSSAGAYQFGFNFDELPAHGYSIAARIERFRQATSEKAMRSEAMAILMDCQPGCGLANAMNIVLGDALSTLREIADRNELEPINFTSNKTSNTDSRPSFAFSLGFGNGKHYGFRFTDFHRPGTEHILGVVNSSGWVTTIPIFDSEVIGQSQIIAEIRKSRMNPTVLGKYLVPFRRKQVETEIKFFELLRKRITDRFSEQRELALTFEKDFSFVTTEAAAYLGNPFDVTKTQLLVAMERFFKYKDAGFALAPPSQRMKSGSKQ